MTANRKRRVQAIWRALVGVLVILSVASSDLVHPTFTRGQASRPDDLLLVYETVPNIMLVEVTSVRPSSRGITVEFTVRNPMKTLYMPFRINGVDATVEPNSESGFWDSVGLVPAGTTNSYTVFFNSTEQAVTIESPLLDVNSLAFNYLELASSFLLPDALDSTHVTEVIAAVLLTFEQRLIGLVDFGPCLAGIPTIGELDDCVSAVKQFVGDEVFAEMLVEIFTRLGIDMSLDAIAAGLKAWAFIEKWAKVADGIVYVALAGWSHSLVNRYRLQPVTLDPDQLLPWPPRLIAPVGEMVDVASSFEWRQAAGAVAYEFELSRDPEFGDLLVYTTTTSSSFDLSERLLRSTVYYWRVRSVGGAGISPSAWSMGSFMTEPYPGPRLIAPAGSAVSLPTEFRWEAVEGATSYRIRVSDSGFFLDLLVDEVTTETTFSPDVSLEPDKIYYWSATAYYADGGWGSSSQRFSTPSDPAFLALSAGVIGTWVWYGVPGDLKIAIDRITFNADGTIIREGSLYGAQGTYKVVGPNRIQITEELSSEVGGVEQRTYESQVEIQGDTLTLVEDSGTTSSYVRQYSEPHQHCAGTPTSYLWVGIHGRVTFTDGTPTRLRSDPTLSAPILREMPEGQEFDVVGGPVCSDGYTWWWLRVANDGPVGWSPEGGDDAYYIEPFQFISTSDDLAGDIVGVWEQHPPEITFEDGESTGWAYTFYPDGFFLWHYPIEGAGFGNYRFISPHEIEIDRVMCYSGCGSERMTMSVIISGGLMSLTSETESVQFRRGNDPEISLLASDRPLVVGGEQYAPVFVQPGLSLGPLSWLGRNDTVEVIGRSAGGAWLQVEAQQGESVLVGWVCRETVRENALVPDVPITSPVTKSCGSAAAAGSQSWDAAIPQLDGMILEVTESGSRLNARSSPAASAAVLDMLFWGDRVLWNGKTIDAAGDQWLEVQLGDGRTAYIIDNPQYVIQRDPAHLSSDLKIGDTVRITADGNGIHLRTGHTTGAPELRTLQRGEILRIVGGPQYNEYYMWWQLQSTDGMSGWAVDVPGWWELDEQTPSLPDAVSCPGASNCSVTCGNGEQFEDACPADGLFGTCQDWQEEACRNRGGVVQPTESA